MQGPAPIYSIADEHGARAEAATWSRFTAPRDSAEFFAAWLALLCGRVERARAALLLVSDDEGQGTFAFAAAWPDPQRDLQYLGAAAQRVLSERSGVVTPADGARVESGAHVGYPVEVSGQLRGVVVLDIAAGSATELQWILRQIHWAAAWLVDFFRQRLLATREAELQRVATLNELMATALQHHQSQPAALAIANDLASRLRCDRVSIGFERAGRIVPAAISHTASFDEKSDLVRTLTDAMEEVLDLGVAVAWPSPAEDELGTIAHADAARRLQVQALLSAPLTANGATFGVLTLERNAGPPFDAAEQRLVRAIGVMLGPVWAVQRENERGFIARAREGGRSALQATFGPGHPGLKLLLTLGLAVTLALTFVRTEYRVSARTVIEGSVQAAAVAPFDGYIAQALVSAGDTVKKGQPLALLDDRDLKLERARWSAERQQLQRKYQVAMASADRATMGVLAAQINQTEAQLALAEEKLARSMIVAPFDGLVVAGDLRHMIGTPVEQGKLLFEVAPKDGFRVIVQVDDRDIARIATGQTGTLVLSSLPEQSLPIVVGTVTPVATQHDGRNVFRVEAQLTGGDAARLRPGMEGIGKVEVGERSLLWIWTHRFVDWLKLTIWDWTP
ncbi:MAG TPA: HlyD family efflux transporter periplasmic adaptor subunit [Burkholderiales bacterium]|nr:HlyD family efflux transporter periplasmic adaptor subunit [Burkholderiales bacterium]